MVSLSAIGKACAKPSALPLPPTISAWTGHCRLRRGRGATVAIGLLLTLAVCLLPGCDQPQAQTPAGGPEVEKQQVELAGEPQTAPVEQAPAPIPAGFGIARISILPLTEITPPSAGGQAAVLTVYVGMLDAFGSQIKAPGVLRFELYRYVPRSARPMGERIAIWPDIDLTRPAENNAHWRDYLRAYEFKLDAPAGLAGTCILEATCIGPDGRRFTAEFPLRAGP